MVVDECAHQSAEVVENDVSVSVPQYSEPPVVDFTSQSADMRLSTARFEVVALPPYRAVVDAVPFTSSL